MLRVGTRDRTRFRAAGVATPVRPLAAVLGLIVGTFGAARPANAGDAIVHPNQREQVIDGFGASSAWTAPDMGDAGADLTFSTDPAVGGAGLSLLRVRIAPDGTCGEIATAQEAIARGATVWATPWSPPPNTKPIPAAASAAPSMSAARPKRSSLPMFEPQ